jgi:hypothetical protein
MIIAWRKTLPDTTPDPQDEDLPCNAARRAEILRWRPLEVPAFNDNDVRGFVHEWFAAFERLRPAEFFLDHFDPDFVFGEYRTPDEFRGWYADWRAHCPWDHHQVLDLAVAGSARTGWRVDVLLRLVGEWFDGNAAHRTGKPAHLFDRYIRQTWALRHDGSGFRISRCDVWTVREVRLPSSAE